MNDTYHSLASLAMDLNRVAIGLHRDAKVMAKRFFQEALARKSEIDLDSVPTYIGNILIDLEKRKGNIDKQFADDALMYSILLENFTVKRLN